MGNNSLIENVHFQLAKTSLLPKIVEFHNLYLNSDNPAVYSDEFFCPFGIRSAVMKKRMLVAINDNKIIGIVRFYERKRDGIISLYQFAIAEKYRGHRISERMFSYLQNITLCSIESYCPVGISFNNYYRKNGWILKVNYNGLNHWIRHLK